MALSGGPLERINDTGVIAVVRLAHAMPLGAATALVSGGVAALEITLTTPGALETITAIAADVQDAVVGAGTVLDAAAARNAIRAGARFIVSPVSDDAVIRVCRDAGILCMAGAFTPTEMLRAWRAGAQLVKVFPSSQAGPGFFRDVLAPMPFLRLVPSGGVSLATVGDWIRAGAAAVSVGTSVINANSVREESLAELTTQARALVAAVAGARTP